MSESTVWISFLYCRAQDFFLVCSDESKDFLGRAVDNWTHEGASSWCKAEKIKKFLPPGTLKMHSLEFSVLRFHFKTFSKLLKFRLRNTLYGRCSWKSSYIQIKMYISIDLWELPINFSWKDTASIVAGIKWNSVDYLRQEEKGEYCCQKNQEEKQVL